MGDLEKEVIDELKRLFLNDFIPKARKLGKSGIILIGGLYSGHVEQIVRQNGLNFESTNENQDPKTRTEYSIINLDYFENSIRQKLEKRVYS